MNTLSSFNIASHLPRMAAQQPDVPAIYIPDGVTQNYLQYSFKQLEDESNRVACALELSGIQRGMRVALMVTPGLDFFAVTFALFKLGAVPVLVDPGIGVKNLKVCLAEAQPQAFIGVAKAHIARILFRWARSSLKILITVGSKRFWSGSTLSKLTAQVPAGKPCHVTCTRADETAAILFTSGSTGVPKGVVYSHGNFMAQVDQLQKIYAIQPGEIDLPTFPLFALFAPALGMSSVVPVMDFTRPGSVDPLNIIEPIQKFNITTMFGSPALINRIGRYGEENDIKLPSLKRVISAGAPVPAQVLERFSSLLNDQVQVFTPYGATESLPVCSIGSHEILTHTRFATDRGEGVCVGFPVPAIDLKIIQISDAAIASWNDNLLVADEQIGEIVVKGPQVTGEYFSRQESTALAKIQDPQGGGFYHRMGDLGYRDREGKIWFCGRKSHRVICRDQTLYTIPCEAIYNTHPAVFRSALVGLGAAGQMKPVICVELEPSVAKNDYLRIRLELRELGRNNPVTEAIEELFFHPSFPVDIRHNAKIFREKLALWAAEKSS